MHKMSVCKDNHYLSHFNYKIKIEKIKEIIESVNVNGSWGPDLLDYSIKLIPDSDLERLLEIFEKIMRGDFYPDMWKNYSVILLPKPGGRDFRPIALASCLLKILKRIIKKRLERFLELDYLIPDAQYGFRKGRSCEDCLSIINLEIQKAFITREKLGVLFLNIKAAYNNVISPILFDIINNLKIPVGYKIFIKNLLSFKHIEIFESGISQGKRMLFKGLSQESVLSPLLFNLYIKNIVKTVPYNCRVIQFADDIAVLCQDKIVDRVYSSLGDTSDKMNDWLTSMGLELSITKTQFIFFHRSKGKVFPEEIGVRGGSIRRLTCVKYLGIMMDSGLRWREHIRSLKVRTSKYMNILKWLCGRTWGIDPLQAINFVNATIVAQLM